MAFSIGVLVLLVISGICVSPVHGYSCPAVGDSSGFVCPQNFDAVDDFYCCSAGKEYQFCCDYYEYYGYGYLSTAAIIGVIGGSLILLILIISSIIACCVCCARAPPRYPVSTRVHTTTIAHPCEPSAPIMTVNAPPGYYTASAQPAPPQPPQGAFETPKPGQYQQFQNEPI
ncbi:uncharacterized protein LOC117305745 [Asterias rubens]|uniref:uncharacterized protein LOC117305745 n=1 Tax=Asterias rubens TaxID=7604 RepID=UPI001455A177|nr:uncharacterized protein LOC117305745 [Asterias rubens]